MREAFHGRLGRHARAEALLWLPAALAAVFLVVFLAKFPALVDRVYWDSDAATAATLAQAAGHGSIAIQRYGYYLFFLLAVVTRSLPLHRQLWEAFPYCFGLASVAALARVSWQLGGRWAAAMTAAVGVATSPFVSYDRVTLNYHTPTWVGVVATAVFSSWLAEERPRRRLLAVSPLVALLAGISLTDGLFAFVGLVPLAVAGAFLIGISPSRALRLQGALALAVALAAVPLAWLSSTVAGSEGINIYPAVPLDFATGDALLGNLGRFVYDVLQLANGNTFLGAKLDTTSLLSLGCAAAMLAAIIAPFALLRRELRRGAPDPRVIAAAGFWSACVCASGAGFVLSTQAQRGLSNYYFTPILYAVAATVPLALARGRARRSLAAGGIALVALTSLVNLLGNAERFNGKPPIARQASSILALARREHLAAGFGPYWDASDLTWASRGALEIAPVETNGTLLEPGELGNVSSSWFFPRRGGSFLLEDTTSSWVTGGPPPSLGPPSATEHFGPDITMWIYPYDIATRLDYPQTPWSPDPTVSTAGGFNATEQYRGLASHWLIQDGRLVVSSDGVTAVTLTGTVFSNGRTRTLRILTSSGRVLATLSVPTNAVALTLGPLFLPAGRTTLTLAVSPGPAVLGPNDPREASVFVTDLLVTKTCATLVPASGRVVSC